MAQRFSLRPTLRAIWRRSRPTLNRSRWISSLNFSVKEYQIETGKYYRWEISSDGGEEFLVKAPELWRNAWINQVVINDIEVKPLGGIEGVEFDDEGSAVIWFIVLRPGEYDYYAAGFEERGMAGKFVVK